MYTVYVNLYLKVTCYLFIYIDVYRGMLVEKYTHICTYSKPLGIYMNGETSAPMSLINMLPVHTAW